MKKHSLTEILIWIVGTELVGAVSALLAGSFSDFFNNHKEPPLLPPAWLFPVVWVILYAVMGFSAYLVHSSDSARFAKKNALNAYYVQLGLNFLWSILFFRFEALWLAFFEIAALLFAIIIMITRFKRVDLLAARLNLPYLVWVTFAAYLNLATAIIN